MKNKAREVSEELLPTVSCYVNEWVDSSYDDMKKDFESDVKEILEREISKAIDAVKGYRTDSEYVSGMSKEEYFKSIGLNIPSNEV